MLLHDVVLKMIKKQPPAFYQAAGDGWI